MKLKCPHCQVTLNIDADQAGSTGACPACSGAMTIPHLSPSAPAVHYPTRRRGTTILKWSALILLFLAITAYRVNKKNRELEEIIKVSRRNLQASDRLLRQPWPTFQGTGSTLRPSDRELAQLLTLETPWSTRLEPDQLAPEVAKWKLYEICGLQTRMPAPPETEALDFPKVPREKIESHSSWSASSREVTVTVTQIKMIDEIPSRESAALGAIYSCWKQDGTSQFSFSRQKIEVQGTAGMRIQMRDQGNDAARLHEGPLLFRGLTFWSIQVLGRKGADAKSVAAICEAILTKVSIVQS